MHECTIRFKLVHVSTECASGSRSSHASYLSSTRSHRVSLGHFNVLCCILISIMVSAAFWAIPLTNVERQRFDNMSTRRACLAGWVESVNYFFDFPILFAFIGEHAFEHTHTYIGYCTSNTVVGNHTPHVQIFNTDDVKTTHQIGRELVKIIRPAVTNVFMQPSDFDALPLPPSTTFLPPRQALLQPCQLGEFTPKMLRVRNTFPVRKSSQSTNPKVDSNSLSGFWQPDNRLIEAECYKVSPGRSLAYRNRCGGTGETSTPMYVKTTKPRKTQIIVNSIPFEGATGVFSRLFILLLFVGRVAPTFSPEVEEGSLQMTQRLLSGYAGYVIQPFCGLLFFESSEQCRSVVVANSFLFGSPSFRPKMESPIINVATTTEDSGEFLGLGIGWIESKSVSCLHTISILCVS